jgi:alpha-1,3-rhamnosyl/mannosyltransferase
MSPSRVLIDCRVVSRRLDGLGRYTVGLTRALLREPDGIELWLLVPVEMAADHPLRTLLAETEAASIASGIGFMSPWSHALVPPVVHRARPDLYHYPHFNLPLGVRTPSVITIHDLTPITQPAYFRTGGPFKRWYFRTAARQSLAHSAAAIVPSHATADDVRRELRPRRAPVVIEEGVDDPLALPPEPEAVAAFRAGHHLERPYFLYVGVDRPHKNLDRVVDAFASIADETPHDLVVVGHGHEALAARAAAADIAARVRRLGYLPDAEVRAAYAGCDAFVLCSLAEGFGLPVIEAMRSGAPVITSDSGAMAEVAGDAALLVDPRSVAAIAGALRTIGARPELRDDLRRRGRQRAAGFTWQEAARKTLALYRTVLGA